MSLYQIAIFASGAESYAATLQSTLRQSFADLGIAPEMLSFLNEATALSRDRKSPTVGVYFGLSPISPDASPTLAEFVMSANLIVPVVPVLTRFSDFVPSELLQINGMEVQADDPDLRRLASVLLEGLGLLRRSRRLFISYRRIESQGIAIQLYEKLDENGFDVFLDTHCVRPGEPFQEVLWHRLADTDVVVLLDSPGFLDSRWTEEELARANTTNLQILQVIWPGAALPSSAAFSSPFSLFVNDFERPSDQLGVTARLREGCVQKLAVEVESLRARALAARHTYLVQEFCTEAIDLGLSPHLQPERFIVFETAAGNHYVTVPTIGVPDAVRYQQLEDELQRFADGTKNIILLYDERGIRDQWMKHLEWLDSQTAAVKSLQVAKAQTWLRGLT